ncbi:TonB-dependent receptor-like protein [Novosphingobium sp. PhB165]|uniref:TonB-dependent receptor plug domain-containing protein n=1 Tax=Novosphingobium sp. PhB165 TaxID=2485105 RepID=UPI0010DCC955|nr:TonB-dependent receptor [Novosphingobium sp. PhB165]TCM19443.1 TonB-dependent receptor-like protein [Novosphingobium sp. PhB165]
MKLTLKKAALRGATSLTAFAVLCSAQAYAQDAAQTDAAKSDDADSGQAIVVTGSRIKSDLPTTVAPVQVVTSEQIRDQGVVNIQDALLKNPVFGTPSFSRSNSGFFTSGAGVATVDLRNLGVDRTLVLVNGRRVVSGVPGSNAVDLNMIPTQMVERVEVLTSGSASAVYGSDAVAGVVNFILKDNYQGIEAHAQTGISGVGDNFSLDTGVLLGGNFDDGRGNVTMYMGYSQQDAVYSRNHKTEAGKSDTDGLSAIFNGGDIFTPTQPVYSSYAPQGAFYTDNNVFTYSPTGQLQPCFTASAATCGNGAGVGPNGYNRMAVRYLAVPVQRYLGNVNAHYDLTDHVTAFFEGSFESVHSKANIEPFPFDTSFAYSPDGQMPIETMYNGVATRNPFVPDAIYNDASDTNGDGLKDIYFSKRLTDFGPRTYQSTQNTYRAVAGLRGDIAPKWNFEVFGNYGETNVSQHGTGQINVLNFASSQQVIPDGNGGFMCADPTARSHGCVPANIYGTNSMSAAAVAYLEAPTAYQAYNKETQVGGNIVGSIKNPLGARDIGLTFGTEYRREAQDARWDTLTSQGLNGGNLLAPTHGSFDLYEFYGEALVPLISQGIVEDFSLRGAARYSHYSTVGGTFSYNFGGELAPIRDIRFRAMYAKTVRAPNINELYSGDAQDYPTLVDPCSGIKATGDGALGDNCRAAPGVMANIAANGAFKVTQSDLQGVTSFSHGNPNLSEERGETLTLGAVINPQSIHALRNMSLSVDYYRVKIKDAIEFTDLQYILSQCYNESNTSFCDYVTRRDSVQGANSAGSLYSVNTQPLNSGGISTSGIDVVFNYAQPFDIGSTRLRTSLNVTYTHLFTGYEIPVPGEAKNYTIGEVGNAQDRFSTMVNVGTDVWSLALNGTYIGPSWIDDQFDGYHAYKVHSEFYLGAQAKFNVNDGTEFFVGVDNMFDNSPIYMASVAGSTTGQQSDTGTYDALGRRFYAGIRVKM